VRWLALAVFVFFMFAWAYGGWRSPALVVDAKEGSFLFWAGLAVIAAYLPLYLWRRASDRRALRSGAPVAVTTDA